jgi:hypothetical protein
MDFVHGIAKLKKDIIIENNTVRKVGEEGVITAYLPEDEKFAVMFDGMMGPENWFTFTSKESFDEWFDYTLD